MDAGGKVWVWQRGVPAADIVSVGGDRVGAGQQALGEDDGGGADGVEPTVTRGIGGLLDRL